MAIKIGKRIGLGGALIMILGLIGGCGKANTYHSVMYSDAKAWMKESFLVENLTRGAYYNDEFLDDNVYPQAITALIKSQQEFDIAFMEFPTVLDFDNEMLCLYIFTCVYMARPYEISKISLEEKLLTIKVKSIPPKIGAIGDASIPLQRCLVVKMDKLDVSTVEFSEKK